ncbi:MAG: hypothetical protein NUW37_03350 [Planctomycetes bacterium]|nr:hypothetical protein [Planctomycetota bacterium]
MFASYYASADQGRGVILETPSGVNYWSDYRGVVHAHSFVSHDSEGTHEEIVAAAEQVGLDFMCMTDHPADNLVSDGLTGVHGGCLFLIGEERGLADGSMLGVHLSDLIDGGDVREMTESIHGMGGLAILGHAEGIEDFDADFDALEVYNLHYDTLLDGKERATMLRAMPQLLLGNQERALRMFQDRPDVVMEKWDRLGLERRVPGVAGNDSHQNVRFGTIQADPYPVSYHFVNTHLFIKGDLTTEKLLDAIEEGRGYICHEMYGDGFGFDFTLRHKNTKHVIAMQGEELELRDDVEFEVNLPTSRPVTLYYNGEAQGTQEGTDLVFPCDKGPGVYRVEVTTTDDMNGGRVVPWIFSNPIYIREKTAPATSDDEEDF